MPAATGHVNSRDASKAIRSSGLPRPSRVTHRGFNAPMPGLPPWPHGADRTAGNSKIFGVQGHLMSCFVAHARSISPMSWIRQRYKEPLSLAAKDRPSSNRSGRAAAFGPSEIPTSGGTNCKPITACGLAPCTSGRCHPFNAHRPGIFRRFSPIRL